MERAFALPAPAKLNLFLHVTGRRADGHHELQSVFALISLADTIDVERRPDGAIKRHGDLTGEPAADLALRAAHALRAATGCPFGADITVSKQIPVGSGLGGGSSDAATTLIALNRIWQLHLPRARLQAIALSLGADVPFFLVGSNAFAEGVGEQLTPVTLAVRHYAVIWPRVQVPTREIFADSGLTRNRKPLKIADFSAVERARAAAGKDAASAMPDLFGVNDLEAVTRRRFTEVDRALRTLEQRGPARMTGSGSAVFMPCESPQHAIAAIEQLPSGWQGWAVSGMANHPLAAWLL